ncbi:hypothetical protein GJAV_G00183090 [Gymnothorax javanicus]|nr:hypothetical protein GJAV_G00183090 [Gymnothorax javanicus]
MLRISVVWTAVLGHCWLVCTYNLNLEDQDDIVQVHNFFRSQVQPTASNMRKMSWDDSLAQVAARYAPKCKWEHNPELEDLDLGENLYATNGFFNVTKAITGWYMEHLDYTFHNDSCEKDKLCGHYTQVVWAESVKVGCFSHHCGEVEGLSFTGATILVCNYSPPGNFRGEWPYEEGEPCSNCPEDLPHCHQNICVADLPSVTETTTKGVTTATTEGVIAATTEGIIAATTEGIIAATTEGIIAATTEGIIAATTEGIIEGTTEEHVPGTDDLPIPSDHSTPTRVATETDESTAPSDVGQPPSEESTTPPFPDEEEVLEDMVHREEEEMRMSGGLPPHLSSLLLTILPLLSLLVCT